MRKPIILSMAITALVGANPPAAQAAVVTASWEGLFTLYSPGFGSVFQNTSYPYYADPAWGYGVRTQISGSFTYDTGSGAGSGTIAGFDWGNAGTWQIHDLTLQGVGDGSGGSGDLVTGAFLYDWNGNTDLAASIIWDASGFLGSGPYSVGDSISSTGAAPASDTVPLLSGNYYPIGPVPFATTTIDSVLPLVDDGITGVTLGTGPWTGFTINIDVTDMTVVSVSAVPVPATIWLFGSGLIAVAGVARRKGRPGF